VKGRVLLIGLALCGPALAQTEVVEVTRPHAILRSGPSSDDERFEPVTPGVRFLVVGHEGDWLQVKATGTGSWTGWIKSADTSVAAALASSQLSLITVTEQPSGQSDVRIHLGTPCAWQVLENPETGQMSIELPGARSTMLELAYAQDGKRVADLQIHPHADGVRLDLMVKGGLWGYSTRWDKGDLVFSLAAPIHRSLRGVRIEIDPGHGGSDKGAIGKGGTHEADLNLACGLALRQELQRAGAIVTMTRQDDHEVFQRDDAAARKVTADQELGARVEHAEAGQAQLFVSIHHNASPDLVAGLTDHGTHVYFFQPHSHHLAESLASPVAHATGESSYYALWRSFAVIRETSMPSVLVEVNFVSNPTLERELLTRPGYAHSVARGLRKGLEDFVRTYGQP
jgi:N-acetylmuramoyl-L-alanine amidase